MASPIAAKRNISTGIPAFFNNFILAEKPTVVKKAIMKTSLKVSSKIKEKKPVSCPIKVTIENIVPPVTASGIQFSFKKLKVLLINFPK